MMSQLALEFPADVDEEAQLKDLSPEQRAVAIQAAIQMTNIRMDKRDGLWIRALGFAFKNHRELCDPSGANNAKTPEEWAQVIFSLLNRIAPAA